MLITSFPVTRTINVETFACAMPMDRRSCCLDFIENAKKKTAQQSLEGTLKEAKEASQREEVRKSARISNQRAAKDGNASRK